MHCLLVGHSWANVLGLEHRPSCWEQVAASVVVGFVGGVHVEPAVLVAAVVVVVASESEPAEVPCWAVALGPMAYEQPRAVTACVAMPGLMHQYIVNVEYTDHVI